MIGVFLEFGVDRRLSRNPSALVAKATDTMALVANGVGSALSQRRS